MHHVRPRSRRSRTGSALQRILLPASLLLLAACSASLPDPTGGSDIVGFSAADAVIESSAIALTEDETSTSGTILVTTANVGTAAVGQEDASISFTQDRPGERALWARLRADSHSGDAVYLGFDGVMERVFPDTLGGYVWLLVTVVDLDAVPHRISIGTAEPNVRLDMLVVTDQTELKPEDLEAWAKTGKEPRNPTPSEPPTPSDPEPSDPRPSEPSVPPADGEFSLRGDPDFRVSNMNSGAQIWYRRLWSAIEDPRSKADSWAASDNLYTYGRHLHTHIQSLLTVFRVTGDLRLLDEVDRLAEIMRSRLSDAWRGTVDGTDGTRDGYVNWVWREGSKTYDGKDTHKLDEMKTHALIAAVAYALDVNRDLASPSGRSYGAHADFWRDYLVNDFEAKWRERERVSSGFPIMIRPDNHTYYSWMKWHYYMALLTGRSAYMGEAERMADVIWNDEIRQMSTSSGPVYFWTRGVVGEGGGVAYLEPTTYSRYVYADAVEFHLEGFHRWARSETMPALARTFRQFVIDRDGAKSSTDWFAADIGGGVSRAGIPSDPNWGRMEIYKYETSPFAMIMPWDGTGQVAEISQDVLDRVGSLDEPRTVHLASAFVLNERLRGMEALASARP